MNMRLVNVRNAATGEAMIIPMNPWSRLDTQVRTGHERHMTFWKVPTGASPSRTGAAAEVIADQCTTCAGVYAGLA